MRARSLPNAGPGGRSPGDEPVRPDQHRPPRADSGTVGPPCRVAALLDRLEGAGFIERRRDPADRRRVFVISTGKREREVAQAFQPLQQATQQLLSGYTPGELKLVIGLLGRLEAVMAEVAAAQHQPHEQPGRTVSPARAGVNPT